MNATPPRPDCPGTITIVDDEPENLNVLEALLTPTGCRLALFPRGQMALEAAREEPPDLLLLDIRMPDLNGYEICRLLKADERLRAVPVIFISALSAVEDVAAGFACGGVDYITKPFRDVEVLARVRTHLDLRRSYARLADQHAQLQTLEQHRDTLVHMMVHDMRSPLLGILGHLQLIDEAGGGAGLPVADRDSLHEAIHGARLLSQMISTVIDLSRMETVAIPLNLRPVPAEEIFQAARAQALDPASPRSVTGQISRACPQALCDGELSGRIAANLLANAVKYSPAESPIVYGAEPDPRGVCLWVRDRGPGIPAGEHARIFEKFGVAGQPASRHHASTGLGLAFCKLAVAAQGGRIGVESKPGQGSTFWFTLPAAPATGEG